MNGARICEQDDEGRLTNCSYISDEQFQQLTQSLSGGVTTQTEDNTTTFNNYLGETIAVATYTNDREVARSEGIESLGTEPFSSLISMGAGIAKSIAEVGFKQTLKNTALNQAGRTTGDVIKSISKDKLKNKKAKDIIREFKEGGIMREFPSQYLDEKYEKIVEDAKKGIKPARTAKKLLEGGTYDKK